MVEVIKSIKCNNINWNIIREDMGDTIESFNGPVHVFRYYGEFKNRRTKYAYRKIEGVLLPEERTINHIISQIEGD